MSKLIIIRGNSGSGKSTLAGRLQRKFGRNTMVISQDTVRREMLWAKDGEGATKLITCTCGTSPDLDTSIIVAKSVIRSPLFKCAMFGEDANWGRIICAAGYSGAEFEPAGVNLRLRSSGGEIELMRQGSGLVFDEAAAKQILHEREIFILLDLGAGDFTARAWGCDLSHEYVSINADYRS